MKNLQNVVDGEEFFFERAFLIFKFQWIVILVEDLISKIKKKRISKADSKSERNMHMYCSVPLPSIEAPYKTQDPSSLINSLRCSRMRHKIPAVLSVCDAGYLINR